MYVVVEASGGYGKALEGHEVEEYEQGRQTSRAVWNEESKHSNRRHAASTLIPTFFPSYHSSLGIISEIDHFRRQRNPRSLSSASISYNKLPSTSYPQEYEDEDSDEMRRE